jgi:hypothetical protein
MTLISVNNLLSPKRSASLLLCINSNLIWSAHLQMGSSDFLIWNRLSCLEDARYIQGLRIMEVVRVKMESLIM